MSTGAKGPYKFHEWNLSLGVFEKVSKIIDEASEKFGENLPPLCYSSQTDMDPDSLYFIEERWNEIINENDPFAVVNVRDWTRHPIDDSLNHRIQVKLQELGHLHGGNYTQYIMSEFPEEFRESNQVHWFIANVKANVYLDFFEKGIFDQDEIAKELASFAKITTYYRVRRDLPKLWRELDEAITESHGLANTKANFIAERLTKYHGKVVPAEVLKKIGKDNPEYFGTGKGGISKVQEIAASHKYRQLNEIKEIAPSNDYLMEVLGVFAGVPLYSSYVKTVESDERLNDMNRKVMQYLSGGGEIVSKGGASNNHNSMEKATTRQGIVPTTNEHEDVFIKAMKKYGTSIRNIREDKEIIKFYSSYNQCYEAGSRIKKYHLNRLLESGYTAETITNNVLIDEMGILCFLDASRYRSNSKWDELIKKTNKMRRDGEDGLSLYADYYGFDRNCILKPDEKRLYKAIKDTKELSHTKRFSMPALRSRLGLDISMGTLISRCWGLKKKLILHTGKVLKGSNKKYNENLFRRTIGPLSRIVASDRHHFANGIPSTMVKDLRAMEYKLNNKTNLKYVDFDPYSDVEDDDEDVSSADNDAMDVDEENSDDQESNGNDIQVDDVEVINGRRLRRRKKTPIYADYCVEDDDGAEKYHEKDDDYDDGIEEEDDDAMDVDEEDYSDQEE